MPNKKPKEPRTCVFVDATFYVEGEGYRVAVARESEPGFHPTGDWPYTGGVGQKRPWFWGPTLEDAQKRCKEYNARLGLSATDAENIITSTIRAQNEEEAEEKRPRRRR